MKSHADFKKALQADGTRLETLALAGGGIGSAIFYVGQVRRIAKKNTTGVYLVDAEGNGSWLLYDKASDWQIAGDIATHNLGMSYKVIEGDEYWLTPKTLFCADCGKNFVHYVKGIPQNVCGYCAGEDMGEEE